MEAFEHILKELEKLEQVEGIIPTDVLNLPDPIGSIIGLLIRKGSMTLPEMAKAMKMELPQARQIGDVLTRKGFLIKEYHSGKDLVYRAYIAHMRGRRIPLDL
jgi:hypothetical protein